MNERTRAIWRRHASLLTAVLLHIVLLILILPFMVNRTEPLPSDPLDVTVVPTPRPPLKPITPPTVKPATVNATAARPDIEPAPRLPRIAQPRLDLTLPDPIAEKPPPMVLPAAASGPPTPGAPPAGPGGNGAGGGNGTGAGNGSQEGNDYLIRLKAYIDAHSSGKRHREPHDADLVLILDPNGTLTEVHVVSSSGDPAVDDEVMTELRGMSPFPKPPPILFSESRTVLPVADKWHFPR